MSAPESASPSAVSSVLIGVATYRRPEGLAALVASLAQGIDGPYRAEVLVADNEPSDATRALVADLAATAPMPIRYTPVPEPGIAAARNALVQGSAGFDALVFVDDDEVVSPGWLAELVGAAEATGADVVAGPVEQIYEGPTKRWMVDGGCFDFDRARVTAPRPTPFCASNNTLVRTAALSLEPSGFDARYSQTGGSDTHFFARLGRRGAQIMLVPQPAVVETVPAGRTSLHWLLRRAYRNGSVRARVARDLDGVGPSLAKRLVKDGGRIAAAPAMLLAALARRDRGRAARALQHLAAGLGGIAGTLDVSHVREYAREPS